MCWGCVYGIHAGHIGVDGLTDDQRAELRDRAALPEVAAAAREVQHLYALPGCAVGGPLHVVVDDTNVSDEHLMYARKNLGTAGDYSAEVIAQARRVLDVLDALPVTDRAIATVSWVTR